MRVPLEMTRIGLSLPRGVVWLFGECEKRGAFRWGERVARARARVGAAASNWKSPKQRTLSGCISRGCWLNSNSTGTPVSQSHLH